MIEEGKENYDTNILIECLIKHLALALLTISSWPLNLLCLEVGTDSKCLRQDVCICMVGYSRNLLLNPDYAQLLFLVLASRVCLLCQQLTHTCWSGVFLPCSHFWILVLKHVVDFVFLIQVGFANHSKSFLSLLYLNDFCLLTILSPYYNYGVLVVLLIWFILDYVLLSRKEWAVQGSGEGIGNSSIPRPHIGGLYSTPDVQSLWSYDWKKESDVSYVGLKYTCSEEENSLFWKSLEYWTLYLLFFFIRGIYLQ